MLSFDEARRSILNAMSPVSTEIVALAQARQRVTASDIFSEEDIPFFDNSSMDGYALRTFDTSGASGGGIAVLEISGEVMAGEDAQEPHGAGHAVRIMTGAPIPVGADAVLEQEEVAAKDGSIEVRKEVPQGRNIRKKGEDVRKGDLVLRRGTLLTPSGIGLLASLGMQEVEVHRKPHVSILTSGNELLDLDEPLAPGKIRNSNAYALRELVQETGCEAVSLERSRDEESELRRKMSEGLRYDALITSGGVSVGKHDIVLKTLEAVGVEIRFWKVNIKPGKPFAFGVYANPAGGGLVPVFALPGNPVSTVVTFLQLVRPALQKMMGAGPVSFPALRATLEHDIAKRDSKRHFNRGILRGENGRLFVRATRSQSSGVLSSLVDANCLFIVPEDRMDPKAGDEVEVELL